jgi:hypothetical protein
LAVPRWRDPHAVISAMAEAFGRGVTRSIAQTMNESVMSSRPLNAAAQDTHSTREAKEAIYPRFKTRRSPFAGDAPRIERLP